MNRAMLVFVVVALGVCAQGGFAVPIRLAEVNGIEWSYRQGVVTSGENEKPAIDAWTDGEVVVPDRLGGFPIREIGDNAFYGCGAITSVTIPDGIRRVGEKAFCDCLSIEELVFPPSVRELGTQACMGMNALRKVSIRGRVPVLDYCFGKCQNLVEVDLGDGVEKLIGKPFHGCRSLKRIVFPETLELIDASMFSYGAFDGCSSLREVVFMGPPPEIKNFGVSLDGKIRYTKKYELQWTRWLKAKQISGAESFEPDGGRQGVQSGRPDAVRDNVGVRRTSAPRHFSGESSPNHEETPQETPILRPAIKSLDSSFLRITFDAAKVSSVVCRLAMKNFESAIKAANTTAEEKRKKVSEISEKYLSEQRKTAQAAGDLDKVLALDKALATVDGALEGETEEIVKLRLSRDAQLAKIDHDLAVAGIKAARVFNLAMDQQKRTETQNGNIETAKSLAELQTAIQEWSAKINEATTAAPNGKSASQIGTPKRTSAPVQN